MGACLPLCVGVRLGTSALNASLDHLHGWTNCVSNSPGHALSYPQTLARITSQRARWLVHPDRRTHLRGGVRVMRVSRWVTGHLRRYVWWWWVRGSERVRGWLWKLFRYHAQWLFSEKNIFGMHWPITLPFSRKQCSPGIFQYCEHLSATYIGVLTCCVHTKETRCICGCPSV